MCLGPSASGHQESFASLLLIFSNLANGLRPTGIRPAYPRNLQQLWQQKRGRPSDQNECPALFDHVDPIGFLPAEIFTAIRGNLAFIGRLAIQHSPDWFRVRYTAQKPILGLL